MQDNETIALGGLIKDTKTRGSSGLPYLSEIPVLGGLFGTKSNKVNRTELIVLITPQFVDNLQKAARHHRGAAAQAPGAADAAAKVVRRERGLALVSVLWGIAILSADRRPRCCRPR